MRLIPYYENDEIQNVVIDLAKNLLPEDASGHTISLAPGATTIGRFVRRPTRYLKAITFYVDNMYQVYMDDELLDLSCLPAQTLLVLRVQAGEGDLPCAKVEVTCE